MYRTTAPCDVEVAAYARLRFLTHTEWLSLLVAPEVVASSFSDPELAVAVAFAIPPRRHPLLHTMALALVAAIARDYATRGEPNPYAKTQAPAPVLAPAPTSAPVPASAPARASVQIPQQLSSDVRARNNEAARAPYSFTAGVLAVLYQAGLKAEHDQLNRACAGQPPFGTPRAVTAIAAALQSAEPNAIRASIRVPATFQPEGLNSWEYLYYLLICRLTPGGPFVSPEDDPAVQHIRSAYHRKFARDMFMRCESDWAPFDRVLYSKLTAVTSASTTAASTTATSAPSTATSASTTATSAPITATSAPTTATSAPTAAKLLTPKEIENAAPKSRPRGRIARVQEQRARMREQRARAKEQRDRTSRSAHLSRYGPYSPRLWHPTRGTVEPPRRKAP